MNCIFLDSITQEMKHFLCLEAPKEIELIFFDELGEVEKAEKLAKAESILTATYIINDEFMSRAPKLKIIQKMGVGTDNIDSIAAAKRGILVRNVPGGNANGVAELTIGLILDVYRKISILNQEIKSGTWSMWTYRSCSYEIKGKVHGIVGLGHIGKSVAQLSKAFGTSLLYYSHKRATSEIEAEYDVTYAGLEELLRKSDIVSIHVPLTNETRNLIAVKQIGLMKQNAILINVGRGNVVNEKDLYDALAAGKISGAGIDVWANEPVEPDNPLLTLDNVVATPHVGGGTVDAAINIFRVSFQNIYQALSR
ncbi:phosphoglycerate dehydrogenase-like enzyme [Sporomusaceae bacterium BoRhaA]|uniref:NAD(P)-dependent oxidoreductase n=1 Tax=Pelorhabdus rhamnosifermentans TaxID=2772457 RepID=UPI001C06012E|nr:NAD(P)-dependent oxidoreductase [Pelorhabdus rhamnosifermentans]MBU2700048.1 phosphoglycerate dehydrogenase-like enzyme [Pelorhabdus rhamnosifermentans]